MRRVQFKILKNILEKIEIPEYIHAFEKGRSIPTMAALHVGKKTVISLDLKDFFGSIKQYHVFQLMKHLGFGDSPARTLSELMTYKSFVPQGALTSPKLSNIITALTFGPIIKAYCDAHGYAMSIYADDITISCTEKFDGQDGRDTNIELINFVSRTVANFGFQVNREKTKVMASCQRQWVCGTVTNEKVNLLKKDRYALKAITHNCEINGITAEATKNGITPGEFHATILGKIGWFCQLNPEAGNKLREKFLNIPKDYIEVPVELLESPVASPELPTEAPW